MTVSKRAVRWGAAAFALGVSLAGPQALAAADTPGDDSSAGSANSVADQPARSAPTRQGRAERTVPANRTPSAAAATSDSGDGTPRAATTPARASQRATARNDAGAAASGRPDSVEVSRSLPPAGAVAERSRRAAASPGAPSGAEESASATTASPAVESDSPAALDVPYAQPDPPMAVAATADQVGTVGVPAAAATANSVAHALGDVLGPIQAFVEGIALLVRRAFFNEAPTVTPVQLTGQVSGPITGNIGAVDPEGDPITYRLSAAPVFGTVSIGSDGSYVYTPGADFAGTDAFTVAAADSGLHINLFNPFRPAYTLGNAVVTQGVSGPRVQFEFIYSGGALLWSQEARAALESTATILGSYFVVSSPVTVTYTVNGELSPLSGTLASASSDIISSRPGFFPTVVQAKIISGVDANGAAPDGQITWNFGSPWAFGPAVANGQYDFQSVAMHELMHTLGFLSNVSEPGSNSGTGWTAFDGFLVTANGTGVIGGDYGWISAYDTNLTGGNGGLFFGGPNAVAAYGGPVPVYTPNPWQSGSSMSHLNDPSFYGRNDQLMNARVSMGRGIRTLSAVETAILTDLGYTMVPVPGSTAVLLFGVFFLRRRRPA